jgi:hypothetical protein
MTRIRSQPISRGDVTADLSRKSSRGRPHAVTSPFPCYTPHVTAKPKTLSRQKFEPLTHLKIFPEA